MENEKMELQPEQREKLLNILKDRFEKNKNRHKGLVWTEIEANIRKLGGAIFCDRRYDTVFVYHNGAESYYGVRGFRGALREFVIFPQTNWFEGIFV